uniref:Uncharacterized protein n=1 Tax=Oryza sativa subsp. japonica TaxID=39947 RepID=Q8GVK3_ORYSJ|nr:hypothetical protein [Oryza sativa Japonica Group]BAD31668.1 hypothetical protein [Oryza sativa Japonica Group]
MAAPTAGVAEPPMARKNKITALGDGVHDLVVKQEHGLPLKQVATLLALPIYWTDLTLHAPSDVHGFIDPSVYAS